jgi:TRAP-type C4-dicarboxylate transport system permease small subunit
MRYLVAGLALVAAEVMAVVYWWSSEAWDCGVHCSADQEAAGWTVLVLPILLMGLTVVALVRGLTRLRRQRRGSHPGEGAGEPS